MKRAIAALLLVAAVLLSGCAPHARPRPAGQTPLAAVRNAVTAYGTPSGDGTYCLQQQKGAFVFTIAAPRENGVRSSLQMNAGALCHSFEILLDAPNGDCPCSYTVTGGDEPLRLTGRIDTRAYPKAGSITVDEHGDYPAAQARELFEQFTPLLLRAMQEMLAECGAAASVQDFFPNFSCESSTRL